MLLMLSNTDTIDALKDDNGKESDLLNNSIFYIDLNKMVTLMSSE